MILNSQKSPSEMRLQQMIDRLKESDCRITPQRYAVLNVLASSSDHPSTESIHAKLIVKERYLNWSSVILAIDMMGKNLIHILM